MGKLYDFAVYRVFKDFFRAESAQNQVRYRRYQVDAFFKLKLFHYNGAKGWQNLELKRIIILHP
jgi:hypothetical protein